MKCLLDVFLSDHIVLYSHSTQLRFKEFIARLSVYQVVQILILNYVTYVALILLCSWMSHYEHPSLIIHRHPPFFLHDLYECSWTTKIWKELSVSKDDGKKQSKWYGRLSWNNSDMPVISKVTEEFVWATTRSCLDLDIRISWLLFGITPMTRLSCQTLQLLRHSQTLFALQYGCLMKYFLLKNLNVEAEVNKTNKIQMYTISGENWETVIKRRLEVCRDMSRLISISNHYKVTDEFRSIWVMAKPYLERKLPRDAQFLLYFLSFFFFQQLLDGNDLDWNLTSGKKTSWHKLRCLILWVPSYIGDPSSL